MKKLQKNRDNALSNQKKVLLLTIILYMIFGKNLI